MDGVVEQGHGFELPVEKSHQCADANIVDSSLLRAVESVQSPEEVALRAGRMNRLVGFLMVAFLKNLIGADASLFDQLVALHIQRRGVDIYAADFAVAFFDAVHLFDGIVDKLGAVFWMLTVHHNQPLVAAVDQRLDLLIELRQR